LTHTVGITAEALRANNDWKSAFLNGAKIARRRGRTRPTILCVGKLEDKK